MELTLLLLFTLFGSIQSYDGLALRSDTGIGWSQFIEGNEICGGWDIVPDIEQYVPLGDVAEYVDDTVYICGPRVEH